jgi:hypothetical protein
MEQLINTQEDRTIWVNPPDNCLNCGIVTNEWKEENPDTPWLMVPLADGIALFKCPNCHVAYFNPNALENNKLVQKWVKEDKDRKIAVTSGILDPRGNRVVDLRKPH